ncbi:MAG: PilW family protein [Proteobacteria bacterium]|nr:PilW family protein [Pseudomonadota bacterium]MDE3208128.1 PilW family protein [Pseudomonadota bacterium]
MTHRYTQSGFSMMDIMVGIAISLISVLVIMQTYMVFEGQKRTTTNGADTIESGLMGLHDIATDARMAGYGLTSMNALACTSLNSYYNGTISSNTAIAPIQIQSGGTSSDIITTLYSDSAVGGVPVTLSKQMPDSSSVLTVTNNSGVQANDIIWVSSPGSGVPCSQLQVTAVQTQHFGINLLHDSGLSLYNPPGGSNIFPAQGYGTTPPSYVIDMGNLVEHQFQVLCNTLTMTTLSATSGTPSCTSQSSFANTNPIANNIVMLKAQYGIAPSGSQSVNCWVNPTSSGNVCDTDNWATPSAADIARIKAIRVAIITRSSQMDRNIVSQSCTNNSGKINNGPCLWPDSTSDPAPVIDLSANSNWQHYRYRVYQTIIPLRNVLWANL